MTRTIDYLGFCMWLGALAYVVKRNLPDSRKVCCWSQSYRKPQAAKPTLQTMNLAPQTVNPKPLEALNPGPTLNLLKP